MKFIPSGFSKAKNHSIFFSHSGYIIPPYQLGIKNENILYMKFIPFSKAKKHPIFFSRSGYVIPPYQFHIKMEKILYMKFIP